MNDQKQALNESNDRLYEEKTVNETPMMQTSNPCFKLITKESFRYFFASAFSELVRVIVSLDVAKTVLISDEECQEALDHIKRLFAMLEVLVTVTKRNDKQSILSCTIKQFGQFLTFFLDSCWSFLTKLLSRFASDVVFIVKIIQRCTRQIQSLCAHAKIVKDSSMLAYVPKVKKQLEQMIYLIRETLKKEGAEDAFWLGNLKNRYLNGQEVTEEGDQKLKKRKRTRKEVEGEDEGKRVKKSVPKVDEEAMEVENDEEEQEEQEELENQEEPEEETEDSSDSDSSE